MDEMWLALDLNPEPWAVGPLGVSRRQGKMTPYMGRNQQLDAYKEAVKELVAAQLEAIEPFEPYYDLYFWFWRNQADYEGDLKKVRKNQADSTNMQKATEDALQGVLITNDRHVRRVGSTIVAQGPDVRGAVVIRLRWGLPDMQGVEHSIPERILTRLLSNAIQKPANTNVWPPPR